MSTFSEWFKSNYQLIQKEGFNEGIYYDDWMDANIRASFLEKWLRAAYNVGYEAGIESGNQADKLFGQS
jgi:hypothetical protein